MRETIILMIECNETWQYSVRHFRICIFSLLRGKREREEKKAYVLMLAHEIIQLEIAHAHEADAFLRFTRSGIILKWKCSFSAARALSPSEYTQRRCQLHKLLVVDRYILFVYNIQLMDRVQCFESIRLFHIFQLLCATFMFGSIFRLRFDANSIGSLCKLYSKTNKLVRFRFDSVHCVRYPGVCVCVWVFKGTEKNKNRGKE